MKIPVAIVPPYCSADRTALTDEFWKELKDSAFSLAGVIFLMGKHANITAEGECAKMLVMSLDDGADGEYCVAVRKAYMAFYEEGLVAVKIAPIVAPDGKRANHA